eukprot:CAMPEP_0179451676 /NCGR_PEP_ID=MMETSP0799-20121207/35756_1 /TAXON_ID=46947 /ORGANISM="Geminigera cryophila, Strain CCMP2564" /LENGTH=99 /DNA_ID=CAMNT_0021247225 /DNA_START=101 /DNA_END=397 /DNA_ORIENTATION=-
MMIDDTSNVALSAYTGALSVTRLPCPSPHEDPHVNNDPCLVTTALEKGLDAIMPSYQLNRFDTLSPQNPNLHREVAAVHVLRLIRAARSAGDGPVKGWC